MTEQKSRPTAQKPESHQPSPRNRVDDPHPATEEHYDRIEHPGGARPPTGPNIGPNSYVNDGTPKPKPDYDQKRTKRD